MNTEDKIYDLLEKIYMELQDTQKELRDEISIVRNELKDDISSVKSELKDFREETNIRFDNMKNKLDDIEANNIDRHVTINGELRRIKSGLSKIEIVTADNWSDIARLKVSRKHKTKMQEK